MAEVKEEIKTEDESSLDGNYRYSNQLSPAGNIVPKSEIKEELYDYHEADNSIQFDKLTVSGQTAGQLLRKLKRMRSTNTLPVAESVVLMIGTNDILRKKSRSSISTKIKSILYYISITTPRIFLLTLPPIPELHSQQPVLALNASLRKLNKSNRCVQVIDLYGDFTTQENLIKIDLYERVMGANRRHDLIRWNRKGISTALRAIVEARNL